MIALKSFLNSVFLNEILKKNGKKIPTVRVNPWAFEFVVRCVTDGANRVHVVNGILNQYKDRKYILRTLENCLHCIIHRIFQQAFAYIIFFIWSGD